MPSRVAPEPVPPAVGLFRDPEAASRSAPQLRPAVTVLVPPLAPTGPAIPELARVPAPLPVPGPDKWRSSPALARGRQHCAVPLCCEGRGRGGDSVPGPHLQPTGTIVPPRGDRPPRPPVTAPAGIPRPAGASSCRAWRSGQGPAGTVPAPGVRIREDGRWRQNLAVTVLSAVPPTAVPPTAVLPTVRRTTRVLFLPGPRRGPGPARPPVR
jgi:hypothetical protein